MLSFFIGKGGVGKTTLAAAYAVRSATQHRHRAVLLMSTDPAHSLADIFETRLGDSPCALKLPRGGRLWLWQVNAERHFRGFIASHRDSILEVIEDGTIFTRAEIEPLLEATLPGIAEFAALLAIRKAAVSGRYQSIVVDTAPLGHTLRLFEMPEHFSRFLRFLDLAASRDEVLASRFGGTARISQPFVDEWHSVVQDVGRLFSGKSCRVTLVTSPETFALNESVRAAKTLAEWPQSFAISSIIVNRAVVRPGACSRCGRRARATKSARIFLARKFAGTSLLIAEDQGGPVLGPECLLAFAQHVFDGKKLRPIEGPSRTPKLRLQKTTWPDLETPLALTIGKGGVGKTTITAALAVRQRASRPRAPVTICSTDPAPSLDDIFQQQVEERPVSVLGDPGLRAIEMDSVGEFRNWSERLKQRLDQAFRGESRGIHVDLSFDRQVILALLDIVPPGVDEIFAVFRILDLLSERGVLLIDMAPTGHALELLRMPERLAQWSRLLLKTLAPHRTLPFARDAAVEIAALGQRARELLARLRDPRRSRVWPVMLAEPLPDRETGRLLRQLRDIGCHTAPVFVNRVIFAEDAGSCARCSRAHAWQMRTLAGLRGRRTDRELFVVRDCEHEIAGARALKAFTRELWQLR